MRKVKRTLSAYSESMDRSSRKTMSREAFVDMDEKGAAWFLGHMQSSSLALRDKAKDADFILDIRDARLPFTTENPNIRRLTGGRPRLIIFNKAELSNEDCNRSIQAYYESIGCFSLFTSARRCWRDVVEAVQRFTTHVLPPKTYKTTAHVGLVVGMPNVGKSTLINSLRMAHEYQFHREDFRRSRTPETVAITPGTTRALKMVPLSKDPNVVLYDTPGLTLPGCFAKEAGLKLAACGIVPMNDVSLPQGVVARYIYDLLAAAGTTEHMAECLHLPRAPITFDDCVAMICERSGSSGQTDLGNFDPVRAQRFFLHDFQCGNLGRVTLDPLPRQFLKANQGVAAANTPRLEDGTGCAAGPHATSSTQRGPGGGTHTGTEEDLGAFTYHVETSDVVERYPEHMRPVIEKLRGPPERSTRFSSARQEEVADTVISRKRGPISSASAFDDSYKTHTRLMRGR